MTYRIVLAMLLTAMIALPGRAQACESCCHDSTESLAQRLKYQITPYIFQRDAPYQAGVTGGGSKSAVAGLGLRLKGPLGSKSRWDWSVQGGYGLGDVKSTVTSGTSSNTFETKLSTYDLRLGLDYRHGRRGGGFYCGPGFEYMSTKPTLKLTGFADEKPNAFKVFGFDAHLGGYIPLSRKVRLFGETSELIGRGSFKETIGTQRVETTGLYSVNSWEGGMAYRF